MFRNVNKFSGTLLRFYFTASTGGSNFQSSTAEIRAYANSQSYATSDGWALFRGSTAGYSIVEMHYTSGTHSSTSAPSVSYSTSELFSNSWVDTGGYAKITSMSSTQVKVKLYRSSNHDFSNVYKMTFRFYSERINPNTCTDVTFVSSRYSDNHKT